MKKILIIIAIIILIIISFFLNNKTDAIKFKYEYEAFNRMLNPEGTRGYSVLNISKTNTVRYTPEEEIINIIKRGTGIIYFGFPNCPWCRTAVPILTEVAEEKNIVINYLNILDIRSSYMLENETKAKMKYVGTDNYYIFLELLDSYLDDYSLTNKSGEKIKTGEKRLLAPTVVFVKDGEILGFHVGTIESQKDAYLELTKEQKEELKNIYLENINKIN